LQVRILGSPDQRHSLAQWELSTVPPQAMRVVAGHRLVRQLFEDRRHEAVTVAWQRGYAAARIRQHATEREHLLREIAFLDLRCSPAS